jgi:hypothetical protein
VLGNNGDMRVVPIATLDDAIAAVEAAVAGEDAALPACTVS